MKCLAINRIAPPLHCYNRKTKVEISSYYYYIFMFGFNNISLFGKSLILIKKKCHNNGSLGNCIFII